MKNCFSGEKLTVHFLLFLFVLGVLNDYYVAMGLTYVGAHDFPTKHFFWCSSANWTFAILPEVVPGISHIFDKVQVYFSG